MSVRGIYKTKTPESGAEYAGMDYGQPSTIEEIPRAQYEANGYAPPFDLLPPKTEGWHVEFVDEAGKTRVFKVGIADKNEAVKAAVAGRVATNIKVSPLNQGEFKALSLADGQVLESGRIN